MHPFFSVHFISRRSLQQKAPPPHTQYAQLKIWSSCGLNKVLFSDGKQSYNGCSCSENWLVLLKRMMQWAVLVHKRRGITFIIQLLGLSDCPFYAYHLQCYNEMLKSPTRPPPATNMHGSFFFLFINNNNPVRSLQEVDVNRSTEVGYHWC